MTKPPIAYSCVRCFDRKVKCSREQPTCEACLKHGQSCEYRVPAKPQRRKRRAQEDVLQQKLKHYEQLLAQNGVKVANLTSDGTKIDDDHKEESTNPGSGTNTDDIASPGTDVTTGSTRQFINTQLVFNDKKSQYLENLWTRVAEELGSPQDALADSSDEDDDDAEDKCGLVEDNIDFFLGVVSPATAIKTSHPSRKHIETLWELYLQNVHPLCMIVHRPTLSKTLEKAIMHIDKLPRNLEVLLFSIYAAAVSSLTEKECQRYFDENRQPLLNRYRDATKIALSRAKFLCTQDLVVLQAFVIHLLTTRDLYHAGTLWTLTGVAKRIAEGMGLHKDGLTLGLPPFETEIRRRVWWQMTMLNFRSAEMSGSNKFRDVDALMNGADRPTNINEEDIWPGMTSPPQPREGATDMYFCSLRYEFGSFWRRKMAEKKMERIDIWGNYNSMAEMAQRDANLDELEAILETKFLRYCDPTIPVQFMTLLVGRFAPSIMRLIVHHPRRYASDEDIPKSEKALLLGIAMKHIEMFGMLSSDRNLKKFAWHTSYYFQWQAFIHLLDCLLADPRLPEADRAWGLIEEIHENDPLLLTNVRKPVVVAVGAVCLKAYDAREQAMLADGKSIPRFTPEVITALRQQRDVITTRRRKREQKQALENQRHWMVNQQQTQTQIQPQTQPNGTQASYPQQTLDASMRDQFSNFQISDPNYLVSYPPAASMSTPLWYEDLGFQQTQPMDFESMIAQNLTMDDTRMDWSQWDKLLQDLGS